MAERARVSATAKYDMTTFDEVLVKDSIDFMKKAKDSGKPFFLWHNTTRMHVFTFLAAKYKAMMNPETNYGMEEAGMAQLDNSRRRAAERPGRSRRRRQYHCRVLHRQRRRGVHLAGRRDDPVPCYQGHRL